MNQMRTLIYLTVALVAYLRTAESAVVAHHSDPVRKPITIKKFNQMDLQPRSEPEPPQYQEHSFMMITATTEGPGSGPGGYLGQAGFGDRNGAHDGISVEMMIVEFADQPTEKRKVPKKFGSSGPLSIGSSPMFNAANDRGDRSTPSPPSLQNASRPSDVTNNLQQRLDSLRKAQSIGGDMEPNLAALFSFMTTPVDHVQTSSPKDSSVTTQAAQPQVSFNEPVAPKASESISFTKAPEKQVFLGSSSTFDNTSHHSQL